MSDTQANTPQENKKQWTLMFFLAVVILSFCTLCAFLWRKANRQ